ncbi:spore germination protein [Paenibacillus sp. TAB 01]|uniref:spore germination protein n=1 Tax=Paenibacillus sp. TAB 01 TaxID=3368988 RepID=UPI0037506E7F
MKLLSLIRFLRKPLKTTKTEHLDRTQQPAAKQSRQIMYSDLQQNLDKLRSIYSNCSDIIIRSFVIGGHTQAIMMYIEGLADSESIEEHLFVPLIEGEAGDGQDLAYLKKRITLAQIMEFNTFEQCVEFLSNGYPILIVDKITQGLAFGLSKWEKRAIEEPSAEAGIRGPREGFTETLRVNTSQIRRIIKSPHLKMESITIGEYTQTRTVIAYIDGLADLTVVDEIKKRLQEVQIDGILESGYIEELIRDHPFSPFPLMLNTERPDVACSNLLEGRVAVLTEGTPFVLVAPITLFSLMQTQEDYYQGYWYGTMTRLLRYCFTLISLLLPSFYVAVLTFHQEMIPGSLLVSMASSREEIPFPALVEVIIMEVFFEALREAGIRLPKQIGAAVSIVGALVIGQAAVQAGLISAPMVIVVALGGISSFMIPRYVAGIAIRMLRFPLMMLAGTLGLAGIMMGLILIVLHLCKLRSFGVPYLASITNPQLKELKDVLFRSPWWMMNTRPRLTGGYNKYRQGNRQMSASWEEDE